jgi:hypothetical protein
MTVNLGAGHSTTGLAMVGGSIGTNSGLRPERWSSPPLRALQLAWLANQSAMTPP